MPAIVGGICLGCLAVLATFRSSERDALRSVHPCCRPPPPPPPWSGSLPDRTGRESDGSWAVVGRLSPRPRQPGRFSVTDRRTAPELLPPPSPPSLSRPSRGWVRTRLRRSLGARGVSPCLRHRRGSAWRTPLPPRESTPRRLLRTTPARVAARRKAPLLRPVRLTGSTSENRGHGQSGRQGSWAR